MRLLIYGDIGGSGGYVRYCKGLLGSNAVPKDVEVWFICSLKFYNQLAPLDPEINVITHPWMDSISRLKRYLWYFFVYPNKVRIIKPDVEFYPTGQLRVYLRKAITVSTCHNLLLFDSVELKRIQNEKEQQFYQRYKRNQAKSFVKSDAVIFLSEHSRKVVCKDLPGIRNATVIAHGLDTIFRFPLKRSYELGQRIKLLYVSPIYYYKHHVEVIKAVKMLREQLRLDLNINIIGGGNPTAIVELKQFVQRENADVFVNIKGPLNYEALLKEYGSADIFVFASSSETFGITILEAMGSRLPIACSNRTGLPDILKDAGTYFNPEDPKSIVEAIRILLFDVNLRETLGKKAYRNSQDYTWERCATQTFNYIRKLKLENGK